MSATPVHDWLRPRLERLLRDAEAAGIPREASLAALIDLITLIPDDHG